MRLSAYLGLSLLLLALAGCGGSNASTSSETTPPDTTNPPGDGDDNGGGDSGGDGDGGDDDGGNDNGGGDTGTPPPDCAFTDPVAPVVSETLGNTNDPDMYSLAHYSEREDLNTDLTGTWVMVHRQTKFDFNPEENARDTLQVWQKSVFIIRNSGGTYEAADCSGTGFKALSITEDRLTLPVFGSISGAPSFALVQHSQSAMTGINPTNSGNITYSDQFTGAIKVSDAVMPLGQSSITINAGSDSNADILCVTQKRELMMKQVCTELAQPAVLTLTMTAATAGDQHNLRFRSDGVYTLSSQLGTTIQLTAPTTNTISADASSVSVNLTLNNAVTIPEASPATGSLIFTATLPGAVPAP